jgi:hypothetical protein
MSAFVDAVSEALHELDREDCNTDRVVIYTHPETLEEAKEEMDYLQPFTQGAEVYGKTIEVTPNVPKDMIVVAHLDAAMIGPVGVQFQEVK